MSKVYLEVGKRYIAKNGTVVGPMENAITAGLLRCSNASLRQTCTPNISQIWNLDGTVHRMEAGEEGHDLVTEVKVYNVEEMALSAANLRVSQLEGELSSVRDNLSLAAADVNRLTASRDEARVESEKWKGLYFQEKFFKDLSKSRKIAPPFGRYASGGFLGVANTDAANSLDSRVDGAFDAIRRLQSELERDRKSTNGRAIFFGSLGSAMVVAVAFLAHFLF